MRGKKTVTTKGAEKKAQPENTARPPNPFPVGNQFWMLRSKHGRDKLFASPDLLWEAACEYFQWCQDNPLYEIKAFAYQGEVVTKELPKMRAMTLSGLCFYLNCNEAYFRQFKNSPSEGETGFSTVIEDIERIIYTQKFQGAAADLLNANIIARDLGLIDKSQTESDVKGEITIVRKIIHKND